MDTADFFNKNSNFYGSLKPYKHDYFFLEIIKKRSKGCNLLDIGGGGGCFSKLCYKHFKKANICIIDPSTSLLEKQDMKGIKLVIGRLPDKLNIFEKYDYIHIKEVLHHVTGHSVKESKNYLKKSIMTSLNHLNKNGYLFIHELYFESYVVPSFSRSLIFYLCKIQNYLGIKIPIKGFKEGLDVCFYTRTELKALFEELELKVVDYYEEEWEKNNMKKKAFLKNWGRACYVLQRISD